MAITTLDFDALTEDLESIFNEAKTSAIAESVGMSLFDVKDEVRQTHKHQILHGLGNTQKVAQGADLPNVTTNEGDSITWTQSRYGQLIPITKDMRMFDLYDEIENLVRTSTDDSFDKIDQSFSDILLKGWDTSYTDVYNETVSGLGADGLILFSSAHTNNINSNTFSNLISTDAAGSNVNPTLSREAVVATRARARKYTDPVGVHRPTKLDTLIVGPDMEDEAYRIINSNLIAGSANNDTNQSLKSIKIIVWDRLGSASDGTDTSAYWFMADSKKVKNTLKARFAERPSLDAPEQVYKNKNWEYSVDFYYSRGFGFPAYIFGSNGTGS